MLIQSLLVIDDNTEAEKTMELWGSGEAVRDSCILYSRGLLESARGNQDEAYILFDEALKFNSHKDTVRKALL